MYPIVMARLASGAEVGVEDLRGHKWDERDREDEQRDVRVPLVLFEPLLTCVRIWPRSGVHRARGRDVDSSDCAPLAMVGSDTRRSTWDRCRE